MLSLEATRDKDEVRRFDERMRKSLNDKVRALLEEKFDGASVELVYEGGILTRAVTRGDGREGEEVTENVKTIRSVPLRLHGEDRKAPKLLALRGEVMMEISAFETLNRKLLEVGNEPLPICAMPAAGSRHQLDPRTTAQRPLDVVVYEVLAAKGVRFSTDSQALNAIGRMGGYQYRNRVFEVSTGSEIAEPERKREPPFKMASKCPACGSQVVERGPLQFVRITSPATDTIVGFKSGNKMRRKYSNQFQSIYFVTS